MVRKKNMHRNNCFSMPKIKNGDDVLIEEVYQFLTAKEAVK
jgi:hypothetical protein